MTLLSSSRLFQFHRTPEEFPARARRSWRQKFTEALRGLKFGIRGQSSFFVHFFFAALVVVTAVVLQCSMLEWCVLIGCIGFVLVTEMMNSAVETLFRGLQEEAQEKVWPCLDIAAGAVLLAGLFAAVVGSIIFLGRLWSILGSLAG